MNETDRARVEGYLKEVRAGLRGLPAIDADDTLAEMRTHILEEIGERGDAAAVLRDFGVAAEVASEIVEHRLQPDDGPAVPVAPIGLRYSAWATDVVVGFGPLVLVPTLISFPFVSVGLLGEGTIMPIWVVLVAMVLTRWVMSPAELAQSSMVNPSIPAWQWVMLAVLIGWAAFYWLVLRRQQSASLGMWMTQLRGVRVNDERIVVRTRDISQHPAPLGSGRSRWWILIVAIPTGCLCILLALYYITFGVGAFLQPWDSWAQPFEARQDSERGRALVEDFAGGLVTGDAEAAARVTDGSVDAQIAELVDRWAEPGFRTYNIYVQAAGWIILSEQVTTGGTTGWRDSHLRIEKTERADGYDYIESYRITAIELDDMLRPDEPLPER
ncbi:MAG: hypothetical protein U1E08_03580 [Coriobacteriia bacterium]|nr:hypothetical protein [Coriobacteriia bacterium]